MDILEKALKRTGFISILESFLFIILGIILIWKAEVALKVIACILGTIFILIGIAKVGEHIVSNKENLDMYNFNLIYGLMAIVIGVVTIYYSQTIETILRIIIGVWIIYSSIIRFSLSLKLKKIEARAWIGSTLLAVAMFFCGLYVILNAGTIITTIGVMMIIYSIMDIVEDVIFIKYLSELYD